MNLGYYHRPLNAEQMWFLAAIVESGVEVERKDSFDPFVINNIPCNGLSMKYLISVGAVIVTKVKDTPSSNKPAMVVRVNEHHKLVKCIKYIGKWAKVTGREGAYLCVGIGYKEFSETVMIKLDVSHHAWIDESQIISII